MTTSGMWMFFGFKNYPIALLMAGATLVCTSMTAEAADPASCFPALRRASGPRLICQHDAWMKDEEREDLKKLTRGYLLDARCAVAVDMDRQQVDEAMAASDRVFDAPPQPVTCELQTSRGPLTITGTFAPHVVFKDGFAVDASPGLANVTGVNSYLAWPVVSYVNGASRIKNEMTAMINRFREQLQQGKQAAR